MSVNNEQIVSQTNQQTKLSIEVVSVSKTYHQKTAIKDITFSVHAGEFVAVLGPSGAGKTTLFRCMVGLLKPDHGHVSLLGNNITQLHRSQRRSMAVIFQQFNLVNRISALDNVLAGRLGHTPAWRGWLKQFTRQDRLLALDCLNRVGLINKAMQRADTLSGGEQQRVAIARALAQQPDVIIADEPVASLDPKIGSEILDILYNICKKDGVAIICSLHQLQFAQKYADRIVGLANGRLVVDSNTQSFDANLAAQLYGNSGLTEMR